MLELSISCAVSGSQEETNNYMANIFVIYNDLTNIVTSLLRSLRLAIKWRDSAASIKYSVLVITSRSQTFYNYLRYTVEPRH